MSNQEVGYSEEVCHFCGKGNAGYGRREDGAAGNSKYFDACESCARKPYPQPVQFQKTEEVAA